MAVLISLVCSATALAGQKRSLFVTVMQSEPALASQQGIEQLIQDAVDARVDTLFLQIYRANIAWFPSEVAENSRYRQAAAEIGEDPVALLIRKAHQQGIEVHAWLNVLSLSQNTNAWILKKYGNDILTRNKRRKRHLEDYKIDNQYFLDAGSLKVREYLVRVIHEIVAAYPGLDGIQLDYIRYPDTKPDYGFAPENLERFKQARLGKADKKNLAWEDWKRRQVIELVQILKQSARQGNPEIQFSTTACAPYVRAYHEAHQDWPYLLEHGIVDFVTLMSYPATAEEFEKNVREALGKVNDPARLIAAVPAYKLSKDPETFRRQMDVCRFLPVDSCAIFHHGSLMDASSLKDVLRSQ